MSGGLDWPGLMRMGLGPALLGGLGLTPDELWCGAARGGASPRDRLAELVARSPDRPAG